MSRDIYVPMHIDSILANHLISNFEKGTNGDVKSICEMMDSIPIFDFDMEIDEIVGDLKLKRNIATQKRRDLSLETSVS